MSMVEKYHEFQCKICDAFITLDYNASSEEKIKECIKHQDVKHYIDFTGSQLTDLERMNYYVGNQIYIDGEPEEPFKIETG